MRLSSDLVRRALSGHAAIGLLAGALLYLICLSGTLIVVHEEWQRWEQPTVAESAEIAPAAVQRAASAVLASEAGKKPTEHFFVHLPNDALPRTVITTDNQAVYVDSDGAVAGPEAHGWTEFLIGLHYYLHLPNTLGLAIVGALGVMMAALIVGGVLAHPRIFRDAFTLRAKGPRQLAFADWHNRLGVWTLPFGLAVAITGALLGLSTLIASGIAATWYDNNVEQVYAPVFGSEPAHNDAHAPLANIAGALSWMAANRPEVRASYVILHEPGTAGQYLQVMADHPRRLIFGEYYAFDAAGRFQRTIGMADGAMGQQLAASTYKLHFGSFGGLPVKLGYMLLGLAASVVSATGMSIWLMKRRQRGKPSPKLEGMWSAILWGAPTLIALAFVLRTAAGPEAPMVALFWAGLAALIALGILTGDRVRIEMWLRAALAALMAAIGLIHAGLSIGAAGTGPLVIDAALLAGAVLVALPFWQGRARRTAAMGEAEVLPAE